MEAPKQGATLVAGGRNGTGGGYELNISNDYRLEPDYMVQTVGFPLRVAQSRANYLTFLCLSCLVCTMGTLTVPPPMIAIEHSLESVKLMSSLLHPNSHPLIQKLSSYQFELSMSRSFGNRSRGQAVERGG